MFKRGCPPAILLATFVLPACTYYVPVTHVPSVDAYRSAATSNVMVTQKRGTATVGWYVSKARMDSTGLHGTFYPMSPEEADKVHHLRKPKHANKLGRAVIIRLHPGFDGLFRPGTDATIATEAIAAVVTTEKDMDKGGARTVILLASVGAGLVGLVFLGSYAVAVALASI